MIRSSKKEKILAAAVDIFREKGKKTTISEIGQRAGVTDSMIYHYFKNKEDLLFYAAGEQVKALAGMLNDHLKGFTEPMDRFREFMWFQLHYHDKNPNYTHLTIFECRSNERFFHHDAFQHFRNWVIIMKGIVRDGMAAGVFRNDLPIPVIQDAIFGLLDMASIHSLAAGETAKAHLDIPDIMALFLPMIRQAKTHREDESDKARRILNGAESMFALNGYDNTTTLDIARKAGVAEGTLYEYFTNKEDLLFSTLGNRLETHAEIFHEISLGQSPLGRLKQMIQHHFFMYVSQPEFMKMFIFDGIFNKRFYHSAAKKSYHAYVTAFYPVLEQGKKDGSIRPEVNNRIFKNLFVGVVGHMTLRWYFRKDDPRIDKFSEINDAVSLLMRAVSLGDD